MGKTVAKTFLFETLNGSYADSVSFRCADTNARSALTELAANSANAATLFMHSPTQKHQR